MSNENKVDHKQELQQAAKYLREKKPFEALASVCHGSAKARGFWDRHKPGVRDAIAVLIAVYRIRDMPCAVTPEIEQYLEDMGYAVLIGGELNLTENGRHVALFAMDIHLEGAFTREPSEAISLMHSELSEALEAYRDGNPLSEKIGDKGFSQADEELADLQLRLLDFVGAHEIDLDGAVAAKLEMNAGRKHMHGRKF